MAGMEVDVARQWKYRVFQEQTAALRASPIDETCRIMPHTREARIRREIDYALTLAGQRAKLARKQRSAAASPPATIVVSSPTKLPPLIPRHLALENSPRVNPLGGAQVATDIWQAGALTSLELQDYKDCRFKNMESILPFFNS
jgi:hypothetical protein